MMGNERSLTKREKKKSVFSRFFFENPLGASYTKRDKNATKSVVFFQCFFFGDLSRSPPYTTATITKEILSTIGVTFEFSKQCWHFW